MFPNRCVEYIYTGHFIRNGNPHLMPNMITELGWLAKV